MYAYVSTSLNCSCWLRLKKGGIFISKAHRYLSVEERQSLVYALGLFNPQNPSFMDVYMASS